MSLVSAHEYGTRYGREGAGAAEHFADVLALAPDFVEFDVRRTADGVFVVRHDPHVLVGEHARHIRRVSIDQLRATGEEVLTYADALDAIQGRARAHIDLKLSPPASTYEGHDVDTWEVQATSIAVDRLGADQLVVTTGRDQGIAAVRRWAAVSCPGLLVGVSLGGSRAGYSLRTQLTGRYSELFPAARVAANGANVVAANKWLARFGVARWAHRNGVLLLVWTVDDRRGLRRWINDPRCWMVTTNRVRDAVRIRDGYRD